MKIISSILVFNITFISIIYSQSSPLLKEIYSFDIGDVFQYRTKFNVVFGNLTMVLIKVSFSAISLIWLNINRLKTNKYNL
jgi:hypothetical protein